MTISVAEGRGREQDVPGRWFVCTDTLGASAGDGGVVVVVLMVVMVVDSDADSSGGIAG